MNKIESRYLPTYDPDSVQYMRDELTDIGFVEMMTLETIDKALNTSDNQVTLLLINSVCGCAAGSARPGVALALQHQRIPDRLVTAFAGQDKQAVEYIRQRYLGDYLPSSPCIAMFKNGELIEVLERKDLVNREPEQISDILTGIFDSHCTRPGPSIDPKIYDNLNFTVMCSSNLPRFEDN